MIRKKYILLYLPVLFFLLTGYFAFAEDLKPVPVNLPVTVVPFPLKLEFARSLAESCYNNNVSREYWFSVTPKSKESLFKSNIDIQDFCTKGDKIYQFTFIAKNEEVIAVIYINSNNGERLRGFGPWK